MWGTERMLWPKELRYMITHDIVWTNSYGCQAQLHLLNSKQSVRYVFLNLNICSYHKNMNKNESAYGLFINKSTTSLTLFLSHKCSKIWIPKKEASTSDYDAHFAKTLQGTKVHLSHLEPNSQHPTPKSTKLLPLKKCRGETLHCTLESEDFLVVSKGFLRQKYTALTFNPCKNPN